MRQISYTEVMHTRRSTSTLGYSLDNRMAIYINCRCRYRSFPSLYPGRSKEFAVIHGCAGAPDVWNDMENGKSDFGETDSIC